MDKEMIDLLCHVPAHAGYAANASELDTEDIDAARVEKLKTIIAVDIDDTTDDYAHYCAARLLCSWGYECGFKMISQYIFREDLMEMRCYEQHRSWPYNDTYTHALTAVKRYHAQLSETKLDPVSRIEIRSPIIKIIKLSNVKPFQIDNSFNLVGYYHYEEYKPHFIEHLSAIIDHIDIHRWKIFDALRFVNTFDPEFVSSLLNARGKTIDDYKLNPNWSPDD